MNESRDRAWALRVLGLTEAASQEEIKRAYRDLAQVWHPDRFQSNDRLRQKAEAQLRDINVAFDVLKQVAPPVQEGFKEEASPHQPERVIDPPPSRSGRSFPWFWISGTVIFWAVYQDNAELRVLAIAVAMVALLVKVPKTRRWFLLGIVLLAVVCFGFWGYLEVRSEKRKEWSRQVVDLLKLSDATCQLNSYGGCRFNARAENLSLHEVSSFEISVKHFDCLGESCQVIGEGTAKMYVRIPPGQARAISSSVSFDVLPKLRGKLRWSYKVDPTSIDFTDL